MVVAIHRYRMARPLISVHAIGAKPLGPCCRWTSIRPAFHRSQSAKPISIKYRYQHRHVQRTHVTTQAALAQDQPEGGKPGLLDRLKVRQRVHTSHTPLTLTTLPGTAQPLPRPRSQRTGCVPVPCTDALLGSYAHARHLLACLPLGGAQAHQHTRTRSIHCSLARTQPVHTTPPPRRLATCKP